jgi:hypothetical protein
MNLQAEAQLLCLEIGDGSRRLNMFGNKTRANMKSHICPVHIALLHIIIEIWTVLPGSY